MTREEILAMQPGRELDALVAEKVMGYESGTATLGGWHPSTDLSATWEVVEKIRLDFNVTLQDDGNGKWMFEMHDIWNFRHEIIAEGNTAPEAICKAALLAVLE